MTGSEWLLPSCQRRGCLAPSYFFPCLVGNGGTDPYTTCCMILIKSLEKASGADFFFSRLMKSFEVSSEAQNSYLSSTEYGGVSR